MTAVVREWLPDGALTGERVSRACAPALDAWRGQWFAADAGPLVLAERPEGGTAGVPVFEAPGFALSLDLPARSALVEALVGRIPDESPGGADAIVLDALVEAAVRDLGARLGGLCAFLSQQAAARRDFAIRGANACLSTISASPDWLARLVRTMREARPRQEPPAKLETALASCLVEVEAELGTAGIEMAEIAALSAGDVVPLQTGLGEPVRLCLAQGRVPLACGVLTDESGHNAVKITG